MQNDRGTGDISEPGAPDRVELPRGLALNSLPVDCPGEHLVTRFVKPDDYSRYWRRTLESRLGEAVFVGQTLVYASGEVDDSRGGVITVDCETESGDLCVHEAEDSSNPKRE